MFRAAGRPWRKLPGQVSFSVTARAGFQLQFVHVFSDSEPTYFALCYPFSYQDCLMKFAAFDSKFKNSRNVYFNCETAVHSIEGRNMQLITVSSYDNISIEHEDLIPGLFPTHTSRNDRPYRYLFSVPKLNIDSRINRVCSSRPACTPGSCRGPWCSTASWISFSASILLRWRKLR